MSPQSLRDPSPAAGDAAESGGRHRRPESLADTQTGGFRVSTLTESDAWVPGPRSARHQRNAARPSDAGGRTDARGRTDGRGQTGSGARGAAGRAGAGGNERARRTPSHRTPSHRAPVNQPPVTGSHRAPGTLPIESWLLMGKKRQQVLLASLVAMGLLLVAVPGARARESVDAVNAAAQRAIGIHATQTKKAKPSGGHKDGEPAGAAAAPAKTDAPVQDDAPAKNATPTAEATSAPEHKNAGPGNSLRTTGSTTVALTFDDGPDPAQTPQILALLAKYQVKATFCLVGRQVEKHPEIVRDIVAAGHTLCNHTWNHSLTIGKDKPEQIQTDLARTNAAIRAAVPNAKIPFFRAPGGNFTDQLVGVAASQGMGSLYWQVDPQDWNHKPGETDAAHTARVVAEVQKHVRPGSIVLSHDFNQPDTIAAYEKLIPWLKKNFTLGIPALPAPTATTPPATAPTPTETPSTPATPAPGPSTSPDPVAPAANATPGDGEDRQEAR
jgi:peptidoglycan-N-acetylglucosamine deacetylase